MNAYQVKYWFEANSRDRSGEHVVELREAASLEAVTEAIQENLSRTSFLITPNFGPAASGGCIIVHSAAVRYAEVIPLPGARLADFDASV